MWGFASVFPNRFLSEYIFWLCVSQWLDVSDYIVSHEINIKTLLLNFLSTCNQMDVWCSLLIPTWNILLKRKN